MYSGEPTMTSAEREPSSLKKYHMTPWYRADKSRGPWNEVRNGKKASPTPTVLKVPVTEPWSP